VPPILESKPILEALHQMIDLVDGLIPIFKPLLPYLGSHRRIRQPRGWQVPARRTVCGPTEDGDEKGLSGTVPW